MFSYTLIQNHILFLVCLLLFLISLSFQIRDQAVRATSSVVGFSLLVFMLFYMGFRPISGEFGDMGSYAIDFNHVKLGVNATTNVKTDIAFRYFVQIISQITDVKGFFFIVAVVYIVPCYLFSRKYFGNYWGFVFFMFLGSFSFWTYGTNGIRNGMATSLFILALAVRDKKIFYYFILFISYNMHHSMMIPIAAALVADFFKKPKIYLYIWLAAIPLSLFAGGALSGLFAGLVSDQRAADYLTKGNVNNDTFSSTGFRWDFVLYSASAVFAGWYFIFKKKVNDSFYIFLWGTYVIANAFWVMVIRANFSNRFAYLSWFMMAPVIVYPLFKYKFQEHQLRNAGLIMFFYYSFTYILYIKFSI